MQRQQKQLRQLLLLLLLLHLGTTLAEGLQGQGAKSCAKSKVSFRCLNPPPLPPPSGYLAALCPSSEFNYLGQRSQCRASCQDNATCHLPRLHCAKMKSELSLLQTTLQSVCGGRGRAERQAALSRSLGGTLAKLLPVLFVSFSASNSVLRLMRCYCFSLSF